MYNGVQYDFVFDVELDAGIKRKLPYNRDQNPYEVAANWLEEQGLPLDQTEQLSEIASLDCEFPTEEFDSSSIVLRATHARVWTPDSPFNSAADTKTGGELPVPERGQRRRSPQQHAHLRGPLHRGGGVRPLRAGSRWGGLWGGPLHRL
eukprot:5311785-Pyramimonas_sp.AAC.1